jgi:magnesium chelatase family protein
MDRIDLVVRVTGLTAEERFDHVGAEDSSGVRKRVEAARDVQKRRFEGTPYLVNARIPGGRVDSYCELSPSAMAAMREVAKRVPALTTRRHDKLLKVARTLWQLGGS